MKSVNLALFLLPLALALAQEDGERAAQVEDCACEPPICPLADPLGCRCQNAGALNCYLKNIGEGKKCPEPPLQVCASDNEPAAPDCVQNTNVCNRMCAQVFPQSCYCQYGAQVGCYQACGGPRPQLPTCPPRNAPPDTDPSTNPPPARCGPGLPRCLGDEKCVPRRGRPDPVTLRNPGICVPKYKQCGGFTIDGGIPCLEPRVCVDNPHRGPECGQACDAPGVCVLPRPCGGKTKKGCRGREKCVDDPRDGCDPWTGGKNCPGLCV